MWKALILTQAGKSKKDEVLELFAGSKAHNYDWLRSLYAKYGGPLPPKKDKELANAFVIVGSWGTHVRYESGTMRADDAEEFLDAVQRIYTWADERL
jgi:hypothetical protein